MTKAETISYLKAYLNGDTAVGNIIPLRSVLESAIEALSQPSLPSNLDDAAEEYGRKEYSHAIHFWDEGLSKNKPEVMKEDFVDSFKAGAEWMAGQFKTLGETEIYLEDDGGEEPYTQEWLDLAATEFAIPEGFNPGDKVIVQIRKK